MAGKELKVFSSDINAIPWRETYNERNGMCDYGKYFFEDDDTGMMVKLNIYPKGFMTKWHRHNCGHGIYVLEGILKTDKGCYGPGSFVWWPEGIVAEHGATEYTDVKVLFMTNKKFDLIWTDEPKE